MFCQDIVLVIPVSAIVHIANEQTGVKVAFFCIFLSFSCGEEAFLLYFPCPCLPPTFVMPLPAVVHIAHSRDWEGARLHHKSPENHNSDCLENVKRRRECDINQAGSCQSGVGNNLWPGIVGG